MIPLPIPPKVTEKKGNIARFEIEGLYPGYGVTIGNSLRRVLLSSLQGAAVTQVKIKGAQHEFSTIPGVIEDVLTITLNLKQLRFKIHSDEPQKAVLKVKGEKEVKGSDFEYPPQLELADKDVHIATLTDKKAELDMEIQVERGVGYEPVEKRKKQGKVEIGVIFLDAIFTPIKRVSFKVENMRVGERTDFDRVYVDIETDGTISPEDAFSQATEILVNHFSLILEPFKKEEKKAEAPATEKEKDANKMKIEDLKLSARTLNALQKNNIKTVSGLLRKSGKSLSELDGMGERAVAEIKKKLKKMGAELKP